MLQRQITLPRIHSILIYVTTLFIIFSCSKNNSSKIVKDQYLALIKNTNECDFFKENTPKKNLIKPIDITNQIQEDIYPVTNFDDTWKSVIYESGERLDSIPSRINKMTNNKFIIKNTTKLDAVIEVFHIENQTEKHIVLEKIYLKPNKTMIVNNIPVGKHTINVRHGTDWKEKKFEETTYGEFSKDRYISVDTTEPYFFDKKTTAHIINLTKTVFEESYGNYFTTYTIIENEFGDIISHKKFNELMITENYTYKKTYVKNNEIKCVTLFPKIKQ